MKPNKTQGFRAAQRPTVELRLTTTICHSHSKLLAETKRTLQSDNYLLRQNGNTRRDRTIM
jgi:hypothetical protein